MLTASEGGSVLDHKKDYAAAFLALVSIMLASFLGTLVAVAVFRGVLWLI